MTARSLQSSLAQVVNEVVRTRNPMPNGFQAVNPACGYTLLKSRKKWWGYGCGAMGEGKVMKKRDRWGGRGFYLKKRCPFESWPYTFVSCVLWLFPPLVPSPPSTQYAPAILAFQYGGRPVSNLRLERGTESGLSLVANHRFLDVWSGMDPSNRSWSE